MNEESRNNKLLGSFNNLLGRDKSTPPLYTGAEIGV
jgi:hypothetical protein